MTTALSILATLVNLHDGIPNGGQGITEADWQAARDLIAKHTLSPEDEARRLAIIAIAEDLPYVSEGEVEIDEDATLSEGDDNGTYVSAWVWCPFDGTPFDKEETGDEEE